MKGKKKKSQDDNLIDEDEWTSYIFTTSSSATSAYTISGSIKPFLYKSDPNDVNLDEFDRKITKTTSDGHEVELTIGEYYEISKIGKRVEDMTLEEFDEQLMVVRL